MVESDRKNLEEIKFIFSDGSHFVLEKEYLKKLDSESKLVLQILLRKIFSQIKVL